jgi:hypothetical protein
MKGRVMREYMVLPEAFVADRKAFATWLGHALAYGLSLPAKAPKRAVKRPVKPRRPSG